MTPFEVNVRRGAGTIYPPAFAALRWMALFVAACIWHQTVFAIVCALSVFSNVTLTLVRWRKRCPGCRARMLEMDHFECPNIHHHVHMRTCGREMLPIDERFVQEVLKSEGKPYRPVHSFLAVTDMPGCGICGLPREDHAE